MSYYKKHERSAHLPPVTGEKKVLRTLVSAELSTQTVDAEVHLQSIKAVLTAGKKHSSAALLRRKLKGHLVRELHDI